MNANNTTLEDIQKCLTEKLDRSQLFQETLLESSKYPCGILIRNGKKTTRMSRKQYADFLGNAKEVLDNKHFPHLYSTHGTPKYRTHGGGFLIPVEKSLNVETIILSLRQIDQNFNLGLKIEKSKDGPCEDGRNIITEWKLLPPDVTINNAEKHFGDFGVISSTKESEEGLFVTFFNIFDTLPLCSLINPHNNKGSKWFYVFKNRPTLCRFVSSLSCSNCQLSGHHHSKCPDGLSQVTKQYRRLIQENKTSTALANKIQNKKGTLSLKPAKKSAKPRSSSDDAIDKEKDLLVDTSRMEKKKKKQKKYKKGSDRDKDGTQIHDAVVKSFCPSVEFLNLSFSKDVGSGDVTFMDTSVDTQNSDSIKRQESHSDDKVSGTGLLLRKPNNSIVDNNFSAKYSDPQKQSK